MTINAGWKNQSGTNQGFFIPRHQQRRRKACYSGPRFFLHPISPPEASTAINPR